MKPYISKIYLALLALLTVSCVNTEQKETPSEADYVIATGAFVSSSEGVTTTEKGVSAASEAWATYNLEIKETGRYNIAFSVKGEGQVWLEDYYDNPDGRTYNVTGAIAVDGDDFYQVSRDGSPMSAGTHPVKLHLSGVEVEAIHITKMIDHQDTPVVMEQSVEGTDWGLVWSDEFEGTGLPDASKWTYDVGNWGWGNNEPQYYTDQRIENARLEDGNLIIEARKNDMDQPWTSARLTTRGKVSFLYGKIEFRAKVPATNGTWAAGWLLGDSYRDELSWPYCGEIDVLECVGNEIDDETGDGINHASCHTRKYYFKEGTHITAEIEIEDMVNTFHTYSIEWTPEGVFASVNGEQYYTYDKTADELEWPFDKPQNLIVNLAMGGGMGGAIDPDADREQFIIDYIRVYEKN